MQPVLALLDVGGGEMLVIGLVGLLLFGSRLPKLARSLGQSVSEFKQGLKDDPMPAPPKPAETPEPAADER